MFFFHLNFVNRFREEIVLLLLSVLVMNFCIYRFFFGERFFTKNLSEINCKNQSLTNHTFIAKIMSHNLQPEVKKSIGKYERN